MVHYRGTLGAIGGSRRTEPPSARTEGARVTGPATVLLPAHLSELSVPELDALRRDALHRGQAGRRGDALDALEAVLAEFRRRNRHSEAARTLRSQACLLLSRPDTRSAGGRAVDGLLRTGREHHLPAVEASGWAWHAQLRLRDGDMDGTIDAAANNYLLAYGALSNYYAVDRVGATLELIPHLVGVNRRPTGERGMVLWFRTGGDLVVPDSVRILNA